MVKLLYYGVARELNAICKKYSNKKFLKSFSNQLKTVASNNRIPSLSAMQVGELIQYFIMLNPQYLKKGQWTEYPKLKPAQYKSVLNAEIKDFSVDQQQDWEQSCSYPGLKFLINRSKSIQVQYMDEWLKDYKEELNNFEARIFQHEYDHFWGQDFLAKSIKVEIIDKQLKDKHQQQCNKLLQNFQITIKELIKSQQNNKIPINLNGNKQFHKLKQFITYTIIDKLRER